MYFSLIWIIISDVNQESARTQKKPVFSYARLHKNVTKVGSRLRMVTQKRYQGQFPVTHGFGSRLHSPVPAYAWLRKLAKKCVTDRFHGYAGNRVTGYADPWSQ